MKQHTVKAEIGPNFKVKKITLTRNGVSKEYFVSKKGKVFDGNKQIGFLKRERIRWYDNQFKIVFNPE